jgi:YidC/Oxa1 family membrane protein insertase
MEKRAFIAVGLSIAIFYIFSMLFAPDKKPMEPSGPQKMASVATAPNDKIVQPAVSQYPPVTPDQSQPTTVSQKEIIVDTDLYSAIFSSRGGSLKSLTLKNYREENSPSAKQVMLGNDADPSLFSYTTRTTGIAFPEGAVFMTDTDSIKLNKGETKQLTFNYISGLGFTLRKVYTFATGSYGINLETLVFNNSPSPLTGAIQYVMTYPAEPKVMDNRFDTAGAYLFSDNSLQVDKIKDVASATKRYDKSIQWAGFADKYFMNTILSDKGSIATVELRKNTAGFFESVISSPQFMVNPGQSTAVVHRLFVGPKDIDILKAQGNSLEQSLDLGWFTVIAKPLLYSLKFFYRYVGNYGVSIIIITIILKVLFFPLTNKSYKSMKGMQKIQPEMTKLREKYKDDRDAMNKAVMELYREHKVNPMGGCLPMVVQIPVFFALYKSLMFSIELRHAPFVMWITDLAGPDNLFSELLHLPFVIGPLPLLMGASMFIQQKMTPSQMDPLQQKMMLALPVVFTFMFLSFPSGLVLYWLVNNVLTIGQQMYINKTVKD